MKLDERIELLGELGKYFGEIVSDFQNQDNNSRFKEEIQTIYNLQKYNGWFTADNVIYALTEWQSQLELANLEKWVSELKDVENQKTVGIVMAGNIPLVGFHDLISTYISGHRAQVKMSSQDNRLLPLIVVHLTSLNPEFKNNIEFVEKIKGVDAVIATGSNNTSRYFEQYFGKYPNIIRKNRTSVAVLNGNESKEDMLGLANDILRYFGLGCRNVSKIYIPKGYNLDKIFEAVYESFSEIIKHNKYANNYDYYKAIYLLNKLPILENGMLIMKEDKSLHSPVSVLNYEFYSDNKEVLNDLKLNQQQIQCVVSKDDFFDDGIYPGMSQNPKLWDYADDVNILEFLRKI